MRGRNQGWSIKMLPFVLFWHASGRTTTGAVLPESSDHSHSSLLLLGLIPHWGFPRSQCPHRPTKSATNFTHSVVGLELSVVFLSHSSLYRSFKWEITAFEASFLPNPYSHPPSLSFVAHTTSHLTFLQPSFVSQQIVHVSHVSIPFHSPHIFT